MFKNNPDAYNDFWRLANKQRDKKKIAKSEIRKDYLQDEFVIIAPKRKWKIEKKGEAILEKRQTSCQFCPDNNKERAKELVREKNGWQIKVVDNIYPAFSPENKKAEGIQEIVIETPRHRRELSEFKLIEIRKLLEIYSSRIKKLKTKKAVNHILIFKNFGEEAGASVEHAHSQIFATKFIPPYILDKIQKEKEYKGCIYCDIAKKERSGPRLIFKDKYFDAICPYASFFSYEVIIIPKRHIASITDFKKEELASLARILKNILKGIKNLGLAYNFYFHELPRRDGGHLYFKFKPRSNVWAGLELGTEIAINSMPPEEAAEYYRKFFKK